MIFRQKDVFVEVFDRDANIKAMEVYLVAWTVGVKSPKVL